jgi:sporulation protein YlmC with PRC-barrel domain
MDRPAGREVDACLELLDRQLVDSQGDQAGKVDDLELTELEDGSFVVTAILSGPGALGGRLGGRLGTAVGVLFGRLHDQSQPDPVRIPFGAVKDIGSHVSLSRSRDHLDVNRMEHWVRDRLIARIPGAGDAPE